MNHFVHILNMWNIIIASMQIHIINPYLTHKSTPNGSNTEVNWIKLWVIYHCYQKDIPQILYYTYMCPYLHCVDSFDNSDISISSGIECETRNTKGAVLLH